VTERKLAERVQRQRIKHLETARIDLERLAERFHDVQAPLDDAFDALDRALEGEDPTRQRLEEARQASESVRAEVEELEDRTREATRSSDRDA